ncbi:hypothetical protein NC652_030424 [Populus alba x Populus x berolinensis]|nr:hypothetical protein NC652_030424 [Populus alba x Populus x berolinensis]
MTELGLSTTKLCRDSDVGRWKTGGILEATILAIYYITSSFDVIGWTIGWRERGLGGVVIIEGHCLSFQVPNGMLTCYSKKGLWEKARGICEKDCREWELGAYSFDLLATGYSVGGLMVKAAERIKKAISCLKGQRDVELSEELSKPVMENCHFEPAIYDRLKTRIEYGNL